MLTWTLSARHCQEVRMLRCIETMSVVHVISCSTADATQRNYSYFLVLTLQTDHVQIAVGYSSDRWAGSVPNARLHIWCWDAVETQSYDTLNEIQLFLSSSVLKTVKRRLQDWRLRQSSPESIISINRSSFARIFEYTNHLANCYDPILIIRLE